MQSHIGDQLITNNWYNGAQSNESTYTNQPLFRAYLLGLGRMGLVIYMSWVAQDTLRSIYGNTTQLQNAVYLAKKMPTQIKGSVVCHNH